MTWSSRSRCGAVNQGDYPVRTKPNFLRLFAVAVVLGGSCSKIYADSLSVPASSPAEGSSSGSNSSIEVLTAPSPGLELRPQSNSSIGVRTAPRQGQEPKAQSNSSVRVFSPGGQATAQPPPLEEPSSGQEFNPNSRPVVVVDRKFNSDNEASLPCMAIQQIILPPGTERQVVFRQKIAKIFPSDPAIIDPFIVNDHEIIIKPVRTQQMTTIGNTTYKTFTKLLEGNSDVFVYDPDGQLISIIKVVIDGFTSSRQPVIRDPFVKRDSSFDVYDSKNLREPYHYRCSATGAGGCTYVGK